MKLKILLLLLLVQLIPAKILAVDTLYDDRFKNWQSQAEQGDPRAQYSLGNAYLKGNEVAKDVDKAIEWFEKAATQKHAKSEYILGKLYYEGKSVRRNYNTSFKWIKKSAEHGHHPAQFLLGKMYADGDGTDKDLDMALDWLKKARADQFLPVKDEIEKVEGMIALAASKKEEVKKAATTAVYVAPVMQPKAKPTPKPAPAASTQAQSTPAKTSVAAKTSDNSSKSYNAIKLLMEGGWKDDASDKATAYMPSDVNRCEVMHNYYISCSSSRQQHNNKFARIKYRVVSKFTDFTAEGRFIAEYTRNVIQVERLAAAGTPDEGDIPGTGMQAKQIAKCKFEDKDTIGCVTDDFKRISYTR